MFRAFKTKSFPFVQQIDSQDCGLACLKMIGTYFNDQFELDEHHLEHSGLSQQGISIANLDALVKQVGFESLVVKIDIETLQREVILPAICYWNQNHFVVVYKITKNKVYVADPAIGKITYTIEQFITGWTHNTNKGIAIVIDPTEKIASIKKTRNINHNKFQFVQKNIRGYRFYFFIIGCTLLISVFIELVFPFFTQKIIDRGVVLKDLNFIYLVLIAQIVLFTSRIALEFYRSWIFIHIGNRISFAIISQFLTKLMKLPLRFFSSRTIGDLSQRIEDHKRVEQFLSQELIQILFALFSIIVYSAVLIYFQMNIFLVVIGCTIIELLWVFQFLKKIRLNDQKSFSLLSKEQNKIYEIIRSIQEIKLNNLEEAKKEDWQAIQKNIYANRLEKLKVDQKYEVYRFFNFFETILVVFVAAIAVMNEQMTVGTLLATMFILGGLNQPISQLINFVLRYNLVRVSFERLNDIHNKKEEKSDFLIRQLPFIEDIRLSSVSFAYHPSNIVLNDINLFIPKGKTTAIVGLSGSGKTTLLKLMLKFYEPQNGTIFLGENAIHDVDNHIWRQKCGVILQDSIIFSDTIQYNVTLCKQPDTQRLNQALQLANIQPFIDSLPLREQTMIGTEGSGMSQGQKQRLLIARAIYKNPDYLFFDEATNSLDSENEKTIVDNIERFFKNKTMVVVAHRLSTVKNADQIIVLDKGTIIEKGTHAELTHMQGKYYHLIKNQLEIGQ